MMTVEEIKAKAEADAKAKADADAAAKAKAESDAKSAAGAQGAEKPRNAEAAVLDEVAAAKKKLAELAAFVGFDQAPAAKPPPKGAPVRSFFDPFGALEERVDG